MLRVLHDSLTTIKKAIRGLVVMSEQLEEVYRAFTNNQVPKIWEKVAYPSLKSLASWIKDLHLRLDYINTWLCRGLPISFWLPGLYFPQGFLTGALQTHARKYDTPIDQLKFEFIVQDRAVDQEEIEAAHKKEDFEAVSVFGTMKTPEDGVLIHGLFLDAARWNYKTNFLAEPFPGEINPPLPAMLMLAGLKTPTTVNRYVCPLYKTSIRAGTLSTTGHSTNFVITVLLPTDQDEAVWILKGTALLTQITN